MKTIKQMMMNIRMIGTKRMRLILITLSHNFLEVRRMKTIAREAQNYSHLKGSKTRKRRKRKEIWTKQSQVILTLSQERKRDPQSIKKVEAKKASESLFKQPISSSLIIKVSLLRLLISMIKSLRSILTLKISILSYLDRTMIILSTLRTRIGVKRKGNPLVGRKLTNLPSRIVYYLLIHLKQSNLWLEKWLKEEMQRLA